MTMCRIRMIEKDDAPAELAALYDRADSAMQDRQMPGPTLFGNQIRALAHHPALLKALIGVYEAFADSPFGGAETHGVGRIDLLTRQRLRLLFVTPCAPGSRSRFERRTTGLHQAG